MSAHAPGTWELIGWSAGDSRGWSIHIPEQRTRLDVEEWNQDSERVAHLIAAAPELLAELKGALREHEDDHCDGCDAGCPLGEGWRQLIAKAEGKS